MVQKKHHKLSLIVPVYRQEKVIAQNLKSIVVELDSLGIDYEIIVVVDGYEDHSKQEAMKILSKRVVVTGYETNHGKGYAVRFGMAKSHGNIIGFIDAGGDLKSEGISILLAHFNWYNADCVIGSKRHPASKVEYPFFRKVLSFGYQMLVKILFGLNIRDSQVGLKLYRRVVLEDVLPRLLVKEFAFDIEILAVAYRLGYTRIYEAPVELTFSGVSSITSHNFWKIIVNVLWETLAVFYRLRILHYYDNLNKRRWRFDPELNFKVNVG